ncbi:MAG: DUF262 domain-containing protein [Bacteroidales bacterium]|nr:DUF262 domain-containing protein [Bacteroidales bacterium]
MANANLSKVKTAKQDEFYTQYADIEREVAVVKSVIDGCPVGFIYFNKTGEDRYEVLDGQQRITSLGRFMTSKPDIVDTNGRNQNVSSIAANIRRADSTDEAAHLRVRQTRKASSSMCREAERRPSCPISVCSTSQPSRAPIPRQTKEAKDAGRSNCPLCASGDNDNKKRIWKETEMDAAPTSRHGAEAEARMSGFAKCSARHTTR